MPILLSMAVAGAIAGAAPMVPMCSWDEPGHRPFMGDVVAAVDRYTDIAPDVRDKLKKRMAARQYDEIATIERDAIKGKFTYAPEIREMHFAQGQVCKEVSRKKWLPQATERGLVYCESGHCIIVPTVCRNVARVTRLSTRIAGDGLASEPKLPSPSPVTIVAQSRAPVVASPSLEQLARQAPGSEIAAPAPSVASSALGPADKVAGDQLTSLPKDSTLVDDKSSAQEIVEEPSLFDNTVPGYNGPARLSPVTQVPEPASGLLWLLGLSSTVWFALNRRRRGGQSNN